MGEKNPRHMSAPEPDPPRLKSNQMLFASLVLVVCGLRWAAFDYAGSPLPFFDQWLAEFNNLYLNGVVNGSRVWFTAHNEHHQITMKLASMLGFLVNGYWDVTFLAAAAGLVRAVCAGVAWLLLSHRGTDRETIWLWLLCAAGFGVPWSAFNALNGMQISFFFADLALLLSLLVVQRWRDWQSGVAMVFLMLVGLGSMASALAIPLATIALHLTQRKTRPGFILWWSATLMLTVIYALNTGGGNPIQSNLSSAHFFLRLLAWPTPWTGWGVAILFGGIAFLVANWRKPFRPCAPIACALGLFAIGNCAMLALGRNAAEFHPRHWESVVWLPFGIIIVLFLIALNSQVHRATRMVGVMLCGIIITALLTTFHHTTWPDLSASHEHREKIVQHYRDSLLSGDFRAASTRINEQLIASEYSFFDDPIGRFAIHPIAAQNIAATPLPALSLLSPDILPSREPSLMTRFIALLFRAGWGIAAVGILAFTLIGTTAWRRDTNLKEE